MSLRATQVITPKRRLAFKLLTTGIGLAVGLLLAEAGLRLAGFTYLNLYQEDPSVGYALRPGAEGWWRNEGATYITINREGWRDREHVRAKPPRTLRIAVLGDSYAEALQGRMPDAFWAVAEQSLQGCAAVSGRRVEVLNFGVSGFSTARELITLRQRVWEYEPDIILLAVTTANDIKDNSRALSREYDGLPLPYFVYQNGALVLDDASLRARNASLKVRWQRSFGGKTLDWLRTHLRLVGLLDKAHLAWQNSRSDKSKKIRQLGDETGIDAQIYLEPTEREWQEAWRVTEGIMRLMRDEVTAHGAKFLLMTGSNGIQVYPDSGVRQEFMRRHGIADLFYPDQRLRALGAREGIEVLSLAPALQAAAERHQTFLHGTNGFGHWNVAGHRLVGELMAEKLCAMAVTGK